MASDDLSARFLNACERITAKLGQHDNTRFKGLGEAVRAARYKEPVVRRNYETLILLADLRNTIQHSRFFEGEPIATPRRNAVTAIEKLADQIERPLTVNRFMIKQPVTVLSETTLPQAAHLIISHSLSQLPVVDDRGLYKWLLTTNAFARWLSLDPPIG